MQYEMKGIKYITDAKGEKIAIMIDLKNHDKIINEYLEDLEDLIEIEFRKDEETIPWDEAKNQLKQKGIFD